MSWAGHAWDRKTLGGAGRRGFGYKAHRVPGDNFNVGLGGEGEGECGD
jgi:hypothetical protein